MTLALAHDIRYFIMINRMMMVDKTALAEHVLIETDAD